MRRRPRPPLGPILRSGLSAVVLIASGCALAEPARPPTAPIASVERLAAQLTSATFAPELTRGTWGIVVQSLQTGRELFVHNADALLIPASASKLLTLAGAVDAVGWDYRFETSVVARVTPVAGILTGDLVIRGSGDPSLTEADVAALAVELRRQGLQRVNGRIIADDDAADEPASRSTWAIEDLGYPYGAPVGALNLDHNAVSLEVAPGRTVGERARVTQPARRSRQAIRNDVITVDATDVARLQVTLLGTGELRISGIVPLGAPPYTVPVAVLNPTAAVAEIFRYHLEKAGVEVTGKAVDIDDIALELDAAWPAVLVRHQSQPLLTLANQMMADSLNLYAESSLWLTTGPEGSRNAAAALEALVTRLETMGISPDSLQVRDGSGLSRRTVVSARALARLLAARYDATDTRWTDVLSVAGRTGTLETRLAGTRAAGVLVAKTGSMSNIRSLAGYVGLGTTDPLAFVILLNNFEGSGTAANEAIDAMAVALADFSRGNPSR